MLLCEIPLNKPTTQLGGKIFSLNNNLVINQIQLINPHTLLYYRYFLQNTFTKMSLLIRTYKKSDLRFLFEICLRTGDSGKDASSIYKDPMLLGYFYAEPYAVFHPELTFILANDDLPIGYIIGTDNSEKFYERTEKEWFPNLRKKYPLPDENDTSPDARIIRLIHKGHIPKPEMHDYPAHLHIDILPEGQGKGMGKKLIDTFVNKLIEMNVPALHLEVGKRNTNAIAFYEKVGFHVIKEFEYSIAFGMIFQK